MQVEEGHAEYQQFVWKTSLILFAVPLDIEKSG